VDRFGGTLGVSQGRGKAAGLAGAPGLQDRQAVGCVRGERLVVTRPEGIGAEARPGDAALTVDLAMVKASPDLLGLAFGGDQSVEFGIHPLNVQYIQSPT
jgi:hypothetical protein